MQQASDSIYELKIWKGENISEDSAWKTDFDFEKLKSNLKEYKKFRKEVMLLNQPYNLQGKSNYDANFTLICDKILTKTTNQKGRP